jgi:hypothetical protein
MRIGDKDKSHCYLYFNATSLPFSTQEGYLWIMLSYENSNEQNDEAKDARGITYMIKQHEVRIAILWNVQHIAGTHCEKSQAHHETEECLLRHEGANIKGEDKCTN